MKPFKYTPYTTRKAPFTIGLEPLDPDLWLEPDHLLPHYLKEKDAILASRRDDAFRAHPDTLDAQQKVLDLVADYLPDHYPDLYRAKADCIEIVPTGTAVPLHHPDTPPLERAARLVQDDLVIMRPGANGYELVAAAVCFPSSWTLSEKFGLPLDAIHRPVPGYDGKMARRMDLIFDRLPPDQIVWRSNWSIYDTDDLPIFKSSARFSHLADDIEFDGAYMRVERQTLRRLPDSRDLLFTIMIYLDPLRKLRDHPDSQSLAHGLREQLLALDPDQLGYKHLTTRRKQLADYLQEIIEAR